ncbi:MAG: two pore domain potassium channel family protein [Actinobacteria bacterium]|nr:two pore domain potassium channel family protein [Actinomycetota bacterium]
MNAVAIVVGAALVVWMLLDSFETLLATSIRANRLSFTSWYYRGVWWATRRACLRVRDEVRRERWLSRFGPASFLGLLATWTLVEMFGWGLVWWGFRDHFGGAIESVGDAWYYSGVVYFSIGFGDILPATGLMRVLTVLEGFSGLGTLGLVIGFLPTLNAAYSARERQLLKLDDLTDARITPISLVRSHVGPDGDLTSLNAMFDEWADWCAEVYDSHMSLPVLLWFRSKHRGHSWVTGLGVVTDAAIAFASAVEGAERGSALRLHRQAVRLVSGLAERVGVEAVPDLRGDLTSRGWSIGYSALSLQGVPLRGFDESFSRVLALRAQFHPYMEAFIDELLAPRGFWGVTAADHLAEVELGSLFDPDAD